MQKDVVFVIDISGSMYGTKLKQVSSLKLQKGRPRGWQMKDGERIERELRKRE